MYKAKRFWSLLVTAGVTVCLVIMPVAGHSTGDVDLDVAGVRGVCRYYSGVVRTKGSACLSSVPGYPHQDSCIEDSTESIRARDRCSAVE